MALPINIEDLLRGNIVESGRVECREGWDPAEVIRSITAFANDIDDTGGGYIILGSRDDDGLPCIVGLEPGSVDGIQKDLIDCCDLIKPGYIPCSEVYNKDGHTLLIIWAFAGENRPYSCPIHLGDGAGKDRAHYVRKMSGSIQADQNDLTRLHELARRIPYDDQPNRQADTDDLLHALMTSYLGRVNSDLRNHADRMSTIELAESMHLLGGPDEARRPLNVGLMFFNYHPERFFRYTRIEVVDKPDPAGNGMTEQVFSGPVDDQLERALQYIRSYVIRERVYKVDDRAEAIRFFNYPYPALEETLVNAMYHRSYEIPEPVTVIFEPDKVSITSSPGPDGYITDEDLAAGRLVSKRYRNRRIGDILKELRLAEGRNTGIPKVRRSLEENGSGPARYITDRERSFLTVEIPIHPDFLKDSMEIRRSGDLESVIQDLLEREGCMTMKDISERLGYSGINPRVRTTVLGMMASGRAEYLYPQSPRHPGQRICPVRGDRKG